MPVLLAFLASIYVGFLFSPDPTSLLTFSATVLVTLVLALLIRRAWGNRLYRNIDSNNEA